MASLLGAELRRVSLGKVSGLTLPVDAGGGAADVPAPKRTSLLDHGEKIDAGADWATNTGDAL